MNSMKNSGDIGDFFVNQLENLTFNGICHSAKDLIHWITLSKNFCEKNSFLTF